MFPDGLYGPSHRGSNGESWKRQLISPTLQFVTIPTIGSGFDTSNCGHNWPVYQSNPIISRTNYNPITNISYLIKHDNVCSTIYLGNLNMYRVYIIIFILHIIYVNKLS